MTRSPRPATEPWTEDELRLIDFLRDRDVPCPLCRYNLRNLPAPVCPECEHRLVLIVGLQEVPILRFILALIPSVFSGMAAPLVLVPIIASPLSGGGPAPWFIIVIDVFGWLSGLAGIALIVRRTRFLRLSPRRQSIFAAVVWTIHFAAFVFLLSCIFS